MRYRRSVYRKKRIRIAVLTVAVSLAVIAVLFVIIGNLVGSKVEQSQNDRNNTPPTDQALPHAPVRSARAFPVALSESGSSLSSRLSQAASLGYTDVSFEMDTRDGMLRYSSDVAPLWGKQSIGTDLWRLPDAVKSFDNLGLYCIGVTHASDFKSEDDLVRAAAVGYYSSLIAEALRSGVDEVLIYVGELPTQRYAELTRLADEVHRLCPDGGRVGLSLPAAIFADDSNAQLLDDLWSSFDFLAADLTGATSAGVDTVTYIDSTLGEMLYYLLRYELRVLVPYTDDPALSAQIEAAVTAKNTTNIQIVK
jgi:hypothetical protein